MNSPFLFDYQINCYSDCNYKTNLPFAVFALTQQGLYHKTLNVNNQDSGSIYLGKHIIVGAVADGCTSGKNINGRSNNQVGAHIGSYLVLRAVRKLVLKKRLEINEDFISHFEQEFFLRHKQLLNALNPWKLERDFVISNMFLTTIIFFIICENKYLIANCGDGDVIVNNNFKNLDEHAGKYFAANLRNPRKIESGIQWLNPERRFNLIEIGNTENLNSIFIATDGFLDEDIKQHYCFSKFFLKKFEEKALPGFTDKRTQFRKDFLTPILQTKGNKTWPEDDATFISVNRTN